MRRSLVLALTGSLLAGTAAAQGVAGTLVEASGTPLGGALVTLLDGGGKVVATASSRPDGSFVLRAPSAGEYRVKAERIGHATTLSAPLALRAGETTSLRLASAAGKGVQLEGLQVSAGERGCVVNPRSGARTAALWEEARKALSATRFSEVSGADTYTVRRFSRELDAATAMTRQLREDTTTARRVTPFSSVPPADLAENGYVRRDGRENVYLAPDAKVLLSDEFLDGHCFRVVPGTGETAGMVGLAFEPVRGRRLPDVRGTMWLDPASAELRSMDFRYTELRGFATGDDWGGRMEFDRTDTGAWVVRRWTLRLPMMGRASDPRGVSVANARVGVIGISEVGGEVLRSAAAAGPAAAAGMVAGTVFDSTRSAPLAGARVVLAGTPYGALTDASGAFPMEGVPAGSYRAEFTHPRADSLRWKTAGADVTVAAGGAGAVSLAVPARALARVAPRRDTLEVVRLAGVTGTAAAESRVLRDYGFYERKRRGMGTLWTGDEFRKQGDGRVTDHISGRRRILAMPAGTDGFIFLQRRDGGRCWVPVFLDGIRVPAARLNTLRPEEIAAVEIYEGIDVPGEFNVGAHYRNEQRLRACGAIVVWSVLAR
ncbi:MAG: hypothetical protein AVDCRST_MAG68-1026 [uncultured Gemmatimonadetes bacterium]|uniref:Carboxypeptidase regulatory-like domain-containing protein n=1 Tax=uncultured Gemmatimonadota bacterium TaxID=203437 RepID=A0A6J4KKJ9_9BACT|nr:MAG: hypothetical protein AVDCRST_MAG68-1026 [uncultured Gemmatimonadota bacterium]